MKFKKIEFLASMVLLGLSFFFFLDCFLENKSFFWGTLGPDFFPLRYKISEAWAQGQFLLWDFSQSKPLISDLNSSLFYPFHFLFMLSNWNLAFHLYLFMHFFMAAIFMFLLVRRLDCKILPAMVSAISYAFSGLIISSVQEINAFSASSWIPLIVLLYHYSLKQKDFRLAVLSGLILVLQFFCGDMGIFLGTVTLLFAWTLWIFRVPKFDNLQWKMFLVFLGVFLVTSLVKWAPILFSPHSFFSAEDAIFSSLLLRPYWFIEFLFPRLFQPMLGLPEKFFGVYLGIIPLVLMGLAWFFKNNRKIQFFEFMFLFCLVFAVFSSWTHRPWFTFRIVTFLTFAICVLAGLGFHAFLQFSSDWEKRDEEIYRNLTRYVLGIWIVSGIGLFSLLILFLFKSSIQSRLGYPEILNATQVYRQMVYSILWTTALLTAIGIFLFKRMKIKGDEPFFETLIVLVVVWEIFQINGKMAFIKGPLIEKEQFAIKTKRPDPYLIVEKTTSSIKESIQIQSQNPNRLVLEVISPSVGELVIPQTYDSGWRVFSNGQAKEIFQKPNHFLAVKIESGRQKIQFHYWPWAYRWGRVVSFASLVGILIYLLHPFTLKKLIHSFSLGGLRHE